MAGLVEAAVAEFLEVGYEGASMERIARRAGVTKGGLYHHFSGKDALFLFANQALAEPVARLLSEAQRSPSPSEGLGRYIERTLGFWAKRPRQMEFFLLTMTKLGQMPQARQAYALAYRETLGVLTLLYRRGLEAGELSGLTAEEVALGLVAALDGALGMMLVDPKRTASSMAASLRRLFVAGYQGRRMVGRQRRKGMVGRQRRKGMVGLHKEVRHGREGGGADHQQAHQALRRAGRPRRARPARGAR